MDVAGCARSRTVIAVADSELCFLTASDIHLIKGLFPELKARLMRFGKHGAQRVTKKAKTKLFGAESENVLKSYVDSMAEMREVAKEGANQENSSGACQH